MPSLRFIVPTITAVSLFTASAAMADGPTGIDVMTLRLMRDKGIISQAEYDSALRDTADTNGLHGADSQSVVYGRWSATLYGFAETDAIVDSTQSYSDLAGSGQVQPAGSYAATHPRTQFGVRNSRFGFRFRAPEYRGIRASAVLEADFLGDWASPTYVAATGQPSENQYFTNPALRLRHAYMNIESRYVNILFGQTWHLFGWQTAYQPNTVQIQGVPGELYARTTQVRVTKSLATHDVTFDMAVAALRPPQRDSALPEGQGALHFAINNWTGVTTPGSTGTVIMPASIAVSGDIRGFSIPNYPLGGTAAAPEQKSTSAIAKTGGGIAVDAFIPVIPGSAEHKGNSLSLLGEFVYGTGISDMYTGLSSGLGVPATIPVPTGSAVGTAALPYNSDIDPGFVTIDGKGNVTVIEWQTIRAGLQYYLPGLDGKMWLSANYANVSSPNAPSLVTVTAATATAKATTNAAAILNAMNWFDFNVMGDVTPSVRLGIEYALYDEKSAASVTSLNHRVQGSAYYIF